MCSFHLLKDSLILKTIKKNKQMLQETDILYKQNSCQFAGFMLQLALFQSPKIHLCVL